MNIPDWDRTFLWFSTIFPQWKQGEKTSEIWYAELGKYVSSTQFTAAVRACMKEKPSPFPPGIFEIKDKFEVPDKNKAELAWDRVLQFAALNKPLPKGVTNATQMGVRACGGMEQIGLASFKDLVWLRKAFIETYEVAKEAKVDVPQLAAGTRAEQLVAGVIKQLGEKNEQPETGRTSPQNNP